MKRRIDSLQDHYVICGFGRVGQQVCAELEREARSLIVIDTSADAIERARGQGHAVLVGHAGHDQTLVEAGIKRAKGLVAAAGSDADNLLIVLSARALNPNLEIVARANATDAEAKLILAGADRAISPHSLGGRRMAQTLLRPDVVDFLDVVMHDETLELFLENLAVSSGCPLDGCTIGQARIRERIGANVLGIKDRDGIVVSPDASTVLRPGDKLVVLGTRAQLSAMARMIQVDPPRPAS